MNSLLSDRANRFLRTLERCEPVPVSRLQQLMQEQGVEPVTAWLDFHKRYAGYIERISLDGAVWGLVHEQYRFWDNPSPLIIEHDYYEHEKARVIACADAHPSYDYMLTEDGRFLGTPTSTFEVHIEQLSLWAKMMDSHTNARAQFVFEDQALVSYIESQSLSEIAEASDQNYAYYLSDQLLATKNIETDRWIRMIRTDDPSFELQEPAAAQHKVELGWFRRVVKQLFG